jgi:hypothetical protein
MEYYNIEVEWMDGRKDKISVGGLPPGRAERVEEGILYLFYRAGQMATIDRVASIPLVNVRMWGRKK